MCYQGGHTTSSYTVYCSVSLDTAGTDKLSRLLHNRVINMSHAIETITPDSWPADLSNLFCGLSVLLGLLKFAQHSPSTPSTDRITRSQASQKAAFAAFQREYLAVYLVIMLADWLQGTNMYTLYNGYGVSVSTLFLSGFTSSLVFGTFVGLVVDAYGRKRACVLFCLLEIVINAMEHVPSMPVLLLGRVLGGISTSLLFSAFESWMVAEHRRRKFPEAWLARTFGLAAAGNGAVAVLAGLLAQVAADYHGDIGPFQLAILLTIVALALVLRWPENYGADDAEHGNVASRVASSLSMASRTIMGNRRVALLTAVSALFEGATYTFVFMWVPRLIDLYPHGGNLPTGLIFASFMVCITIGGVIYSALMGDGPATPLGRVEKLSLVCLLISAGAMTVPVVGAPTAVVTTLAPALGTFGPTLAAFLVLEASIGCFNACAATMRASYIPDDAQAAIMNLGRIPLNVLVVAGTYIAANAPAQVAFAAVAAALLSGAVLQRELLVVVRAGEKQF